jgi:hydroxymethylbilane synthase
LGIEIRLGDTAMREHLAFLNHEPSRLATVCERALLNQLGGGCQVPIGAHATVQDGKITLTAICARPDGSELLREQGTGTDPVELGQRLGKLILGRGGDKILQDVYSQNAIAH